MRTASLFIAAVLAFASLGTAKGDPYPARPVRLIVGIAPGGGTDITARIVAAKLSELLAQPVIVENRTGAGGTIAADIVAKAPPDGYTLVLCGVGSHGIAPSLYKKLPYDHIKDFAPISLIGTVPNVLVVHPSVPARSVSEFISYARVNPGKLAYGSGGVGTTLHLSMEMLKSMTGIEIVHVPYKGGAPALADLLGGQIQVMLDNLPGQLPSIKAGKVRALGVSSAARNSQMPDLPTIAESGVPGFEVTVWYGMCAPAAVSQTILARLNSDVIQALNASDVRQRLAEHGIQPAPTTREQFGAFIASETAKWAKVVKTTGATAD